MLRRITWLEIAFDKSPFGIRPQLVHFAVVNVKHATSFGRSLMTDVATDSTGQHVLTEAGARMVISVIGDRRMMTQRQMMRLIFDSF